MWCAFERWKDRFATYLNHCTPPTSRLDLCVILTVCSFEATTAYKLASAAPQYRATAQFRQCRLHVLNSLFSIDVNVQIRLIGDNTFTTPLFELKWTDALSNRKSFMKALHKQAERINDENFFQTARYPTNTVKVLPPIFLPQETGADNHELSQMRWRTVNYDEEKGLLEWYERNVSYGEPRQLRVEVYLRWTAGDNDHDENSADCVESWADFEVELRKSRTW
jgi:hypothetical protein